MVDTDIEISLDEAESLLRRDPQESLRLATLFLDANTDLAQCLRARRIVSRAFLHMGAYAEGEGVGHESIKLAREAGERYEEAMAHNEVGVFRFVAQDYQGALGHYDAAEQLLRETGSDLDLSRVYLNIGNVYYRQNDVANSLRYYEKTLAIAEQENDDTMLAKVLTNLTGHYAEYMQDIPTAMVYAQRGAAIFERLDDKVGLGKAYTHLGIQAKALEQFDEALTYFQKSLVNRANFTEPDELISTHCEVANCYLHLGDDAMAEQTLRAIETLPAYLNHTGMGHHYVSGGWASLHMYRKEYTRAIEILLEMHSYLKQHGTLYLEGSIVGDLADAYAAVGDFESAVKWYAALVEHNREADRVGIERRLLNMRRQFEVTQYETQAEIERLRNVELASAVERLEQLYEENSEYLAFMAHELKSPLNTIRAITQLFMEDVSLSAPDRNALIVEVRSISTRMFDLINRVLDRAKGRQEDESAVVDITVVWKYLLEQLSVRAREKDIVLSTSLMTEPALIRIPEMRLISILENLVSNSLKFSEPNTTVTVTARRLPELKPSSPRLLLSVRDEGPGLSADDMDKLFRPYQRLSATPTKGEDSTGLGLHIVRRDVERSGGRIWCESVAGEGSTFFVELPLFVP